MRTIELRPATARLRQLIREHGATWRVIREEQSVQCFRTSPTGVMIESLDGRHSRWIEPSMIENGA